MKEIDFETVTTRGGDKGESSLYSEERLRKDDLFFETVGDLDELNSWLGLIKTELHKGKHQNLIHKIFGSSRTDEISEIQQTILNISSLVATNPKSELWGSLTEIDENDVYKLEKKQKAMLNRTTIEPVFILPGDSELSARVDVARTIARKCERRIVTLIRDKQKWQLHACQNYLNRLSDYLFILGRFVEQNYGKI